MSKTPPTYLDFDSPIGERGPFDPHADTGGAVLWLGVAAVALGLLWWAFA